MGSPFLSVPPALNKQSAQRAVRRGARSPYELRARSPADSQHLPTGLDAHIPQCSARSSVLPSSGPHAAASPLIEVTCLLPGSAPPAVWTGPEEGTV